MKDFRALIGGWNNTGRWIPPASACRTSISGWLSWWSAGGSAHEIPGGSDLRACRRGRTTVRRDGNGTTPVGHGDPGAEPGGGESDSKWSARLRSGSAGSRRPPGSATLLEMRRAASKQRKGNTHRKDGIRAGFPAQPTLAPVPVPDRRSQDLPTDGSVAEGEDQSGVA